jgi:transposase
MLPLSVSSILSVHQGHIMAAYLFFILFPPLLYFPPSFLKPLNVELNPICHLLALLEAHHIFHVSGLRVK